MVAIHAILHLVGINQLSAFLIFVLLVEIALRLVSDSSHIISCIYKPLWFSFLGV